MRTIPLTPLTGFDTGLRPPASSDTVCGRQIVGICGSLCFIQQHNGGLLFIKAHIRLYVSYFFTVVNRQHIALTFTDRRNSQLLTFISWPLCYHSQTGLPSVLFEFGRHPHQRLIHFRGCPMLINILERVIQDTNVCAGGKFSHCWTTTGSAKWSVLSLRGQLSRVKVNDHRMTVNFEANISTSFTTQVQKTTLKFIPHREMVDRIWLLSLVIRWGPNYRGNRFCMSVFADFIIWTGDTNESRESERL